MTKKTPQLKVLHSGSKGNCYVITTEDETLLIECGVEWSSIIDGLHFQPIKCVGCLLTHSHTDHSSSIKAVLSHHIDVYASKEEIEATSIHHYRLNAIQAKKPFKVGSFKILPFDTEHDSPHPLGYVIWHKSFGTLLFATDTYYLKQSFSFPLNHVLIECNYDTDMLKRNYELGHIDKARYERTFGTHMSLQECINTINGFDKSALKNLMLIHTSRDNGSKELFSNTIATECNINPDIISVAECGKEIELSL